jgi:hypothetical protein
MSIKKKSLFLRYSLQKAREGSDIHYRELMGESGQGEESEATLSTFFLILFLLSLVHRAVSFTGRRHGEERQRRRVWSAAWKVPLPRLHHQRERREPVPHQQHSFHAAEAAAEEPEAPETEDYAHQPEQLVDASTPMIPEQANSWSEDLGGTEASNRAGDKLR